MLLVAPPSFRRNSNTKMIDELTNLGLKTSLVCCLDAGDSSSYDGSSQTWNDVSGNSNSFYRGSGSGSDSFDPTFHGTAGNKSSSEYFQNDGGDAFWQASSLTFMNGWHKSGATFTVAGWVYLPSSPTLALGLFRNYRDATDLGIGVRVNDRPTLDMLNAPGSGTGQHFTPASAMIVYAQWNFIVMSFSEGSGTSFAHVSGTSSLLSSDSYSSPSASSSPNGVAIWGFPNTAGTALDTTIAGESGQRINSLMAWGRALSQSEALGLYNATKAKFGL